MTLTVIVDKPKTMIRVWLATVPEVLVANVRSPTGAVLPNFMPNGDQYNETINSARSRIIRFVPSVIAGIASYSRWKRNRTEHNHVV